MFMGDQPTSESYNTEIHKSGELITTAADRQHAQTKAAQHESAPAGAHARQLELAGAAGR